jgi:hypothetical protein
MIFHVGVFAFFISYTKTQLGELGFGGREAAKSF